MDAPNTAALLEVMGQNHDLSADELAEKIRTTHSTEQVIDFLGDEWVRESLRTRIRETREQMPAGRTD